jgi:phenylpyruvate tautomerase PptA (4-oxalocrotonate tautomerase family)
MPILDIELVGEVDAVDGGALAQRIADAAGEVLKSPRQATWVRVRVLRPDSYAENGGAPVSNGPVFVSVLKRSNPEGEALAKEVRDLTDAIAQACGRPSENVHVRYEVPGAGRQAFGGKLV